MTLVPRYEQQARIIVAARLEPGTRRSLHRDQVRRWLLLPDVVLGACGVGSPRSHVAAAARSLEVRADDEQVEVLLRTGDETIALSAGLGEPAFDEPDQRRVEAADGAGVIAVVDPYGLSRSSARAIGVAHLPVPAGVEELLLELGWDGPVAQFATVPDILDHLLATAPVDDLLRTALEERDAELEALIAAYRGDHDVRTQVAEGRLNVTRPESFQPELHRIEAKAVSTSLVGDLVWSLCRTDLPVVVLSDRPEVAHLIDHVAALVPGVAGRVTRVGLHGPGLIEPVTAPAEASYRNDAGGSLWAMRDHLPVGPLDHHLVLLNGPATARLVGLDRRLHGPALTATIHQQLADPDVRWRMVRFDPETLGVVLSPTERPEVEAVFHRLLEIDAAIAARLRAGDVLGRDELDVVLRHDAARPCAAPTLSRAGDGTAPHAAGDLAVVLEHRDGSVHLDLDGDGRANHVLAIGHGAEAYQPGQSVVLRREGGGELRLLGPHTSGSTSAAPVVVVLGADGRATDPDGPYDGPLHRIPGVDHLGPAGSRIIAYPCGDGSFQALSTALPHLQS